MFLRLIEELGVVLDGSQQFYYAQSLLNLGEREQGIQKLYAYLNSEGSAGKHYARGLELLAEFE